MIRPWALVLAAVALGASGCGSSCKDACQNLIACGTKVGIPASSLPTESVCESACDAAKCSDKSDANDCIASATCSSAVSFAQQLQACVDKFPACMF